MTETIFVDTNVLVYARDATAAEKQRRAWEWILALWEGRLGRVSYQVLHDYYVTVTRKLDPGLTDRLARADVRSLAVWKPLPLDIAILEGAWTAQDQFGFSFWDGLVVSAARRSQSTFLLTEDLQDGQDLGGLVVVDPFETDPASIL